MLWVARRAGVHLGQHMKGERYISQKLEREYLFVSRLPGATTIKCRPRQIVKLVTEQTEEMPTIC